MLRDFFLTFLLFFSNIKIHIPIKNLLLLASAMRKEVGGCDYQNGEVRAI